MSDTTVQTPRRVIGLYDKPMWDSIQERSMKLQRNTATGAFQYPPGPALTGEQEWVPISGQGTILSWVVFHRHYLPAYPPPYNTIAVRLQEGPIMISNLEGPAPEGSWIGRSVRLVYVTMPDGVILPRFELTDAP